MTERIRTLPEGITRIIADREVTQAVRVLDELEPGTNGELSEEDQGVFDYCTSVLETAAGQYDLAPEDMRTAIELIRASLDSDE